MSWSSNHDLVTAGHVGATILMWNEAIHYRLQSHWEEDVSHTEVRSYKSPTHFTQCFHPTVKMQPFSLGVTTRGVTGAERGPHLAASLHRSIVEPYGRGQLRALSGSTCGEVCGWGCMGVKWNCAKQLHSTYPMPMIWTKYSEKLGLIKEGIH